MLYGENRKKKNPPPLFFNEIKSLLNKEVTITFNSEYGYFSITGFLKVFGTSLYNVVVQEPVRPIKGIFSSKFEFTRGEVFFNLNLIKNIFNNVIILKNSDNVTPFSGDYDLIKLSLLQEPVTHIIFNQKFNKKTIGAKLCPTIRGKLKYNTKYDVFYVQNYKFTIQCSFKISSILKYVPDWSLSVQI